jgi:SAM-dependent methyltransferase
VTPSAKGTRSARPASAVGKNAPEHSRAAAAHKAYDEAYFEKWYRDPKHRVRTPVEFARQVDFVLHVAEWVLQRRVASVLDVGCGEGQWGVALRKRRPRLSYVGVDPSGWAVAQHGARRGLLEGGITDLDRLLPSGARYDLVLCVGMLNYLDATTLRQGLRQVSRRTAGVAYLELFAQGDEYVGDTDWPAPRPAAWYRTTLQSAGFVPIGLQCYVPQAEADRVSAMERG